MEWLEFDRLLAKLWESHLVRLEVRYGVPGWVDTEGVRSSMEKMLLETAGKGIADPVESDIRRIRDLYRRRVKNGTVVLVHSLIKVLATMHTQH